MGVVEIVFTSVPHGPLLLISLSVEGLGPLVVRVLGCPYSCSLKNGDLLESIVRSKLCP